MKTLTPPDLPPSAPPTCADATTSANRCAMATRERTALTPRPPLSDANETRRKRPPPPRPPPPLPPPPPRLQAFSATRARPAHHSAPRTHPAGVEGASAALNASTTAERFALRTHAQVARARSRHYNRPPRARATRSQRTGHPRRRRRGRQRHPRPGAQCRPAAPPRAHPAPPATAPTQQRRPWTRIRRARRPGTRIRRTQLPPRRRCPPAAKGDVCHLQGGGVGGRRPLAHLRQRRPFVRRNVAARRVRGRSHC